MDKFFYHVPTDHNYHIFFVLQVVLEIASKNGVLRYPLQGLVDHLHLVLIAEMIPLVDQEVGRLHLYIRICKTILSFRKGTISFHLKYPLVVIHYVVLPLFECPLLAN